VGSISREQFYLSAELMRISKQRAVSGVGMKDQACIGQTLRKDVGVCGDHDVIDSIEYERRLLDFLKPGAALTLRSPQDLIAIV
jgi:hypothetical protein